MGDAVVVRPDPLTLGSAEVAELARMAESLRLEVGVDDPPVTAESEAQSWRWPVPSGARRVLAMARTEAGAVGRGDAVFTDRDGKRLAEIGSLYVLPELRRAGIGSRILAELVEGAHPEPLLVATTTDRVLPAGDFAASLGATVGLRHHRYGLAVADIDWGRYRRWVDEGAGTHYELLRWHGACPDELLESYVALSDVMNSVPQGDMEHPAILTVSVEGFRRREARREGAGIETWTTVARHRPTGMLAGLHDLTVANGTVANVQNTGDAEAHQGHGIGRWLKAAMALWLADQRPAVARFVTGTSQINHHMRRVNEDLGYQLELERTVWQVRAGALQECLRSRHD